MSCKVILHFLKLIEITHNVIPLQLRALGCKTVSEVFAKTQRKKTAEDMSTNRFCAFVVDRAGIKDRLHGAEDVFDHPQLFVLQRDLFGGQVHVRSENPLSVVTRFGLDLLFVDREPVLSGRGHVFAIALVADQRLLSALQLLPKMLDDGLAIKDILPSLFFIEADHVPPVVLPDLLDL